MSPTETPLPAPIRTATPIAALLALLPAGLLAEPLVISEFMASNGGVVTDTDGDASDWIEVTNIGAAAVDLAGWALTDDPSEPAQWTFPAGLLPAGGRIVVFASAKDRRVAGEELHTNFQLDADGEYLALVDPSGTVASGFAPEFPPQRENVSYGRRSESANQVDLTPAVAVRETGGGGGNFANTEVLSGGGGRLLEFGTLNAMSLGSGPSKQRYLWFDFSAELGQITPDMPIESARLSLDGDVVALASFGVFPVPDASLGMASVFVGSDGDEMADYYLAKPPVAEVTPAATGDQPLAWDVGALVQQWAENPAAPQAGQLMVLPSGAGGRLQLPEGIPALRVTLAASDQFLYFTDPSPGEPEGEGVVGFVADTKFELGRGFYDGPLTETVTCSTPGATLVYTTDGSVPALDNGTVVPPPDASSPASLEIAVATTTNLRVGAFKDGWEPSGTDTQSYIFLGDVVEQDGDGLPPHFPWGDLRRPDWEMDSRITGHPVFGATLKDDLAAIPSLSLTMNWDHLFGTSPRGIYVQGEADPRPCSVEFLVPDGSEPGFHLDAGVQIQGGTSTNRWKVDKLSMRLKFKSEFGPAKLVYPLYEGSGVTEFDTLVLGAGHNLTWQHPATVQSTDAVMIRDQTVADLHIAMGGAGASHHARFVHLYLNGLYWGLYSMQERTDHAFAASYFGGDKDDYDVMKHSQSEVVNGDARNYRALLTAARRDQSVAENYAAVRALLDVDGFIDYVILNHWAGNYDWSHHNWYATHRGPTPEDGKWRFHSWDAEHVFYDVDHMVMDENDRVYVFGSGLQNDAGTPVEIHYNLLDNAEYRLAFADRIHRHLRNGGVLTPENTAAVFSARVDEIDEAINAEAARWADTNEKSNRSFYDRSDWDANIASLLMNYFPQRTDIVLGQYAARGWLPDTGHVEFGPHGGNLAAGEEVVLTATGGGTIWYTLDGSDPRLEGGGVNPAAVSVTSGSAITPARSIVLNARVLDGGEWGVVTNASYLVGTLASASNLLISEVSYHPAAPSGESVWEDDDFEFIELMNTSGETVDLSGAAFTDGVLYEFPTGLTIEPGETLVVARNAAAFTDRYPGFGADGLTGDYTGKLDNGGERLTLTAADGSVIASFRYNDRGAWPRIADGDGGTLAPRQAGVYADGLGWTGGDPTPGEYLPPETFSDWSAANGITGGFLGDHNLDGVSNGVEYAFLSGFVTVLTAGGDIEVTILRRTVAAAPVRFEWSADLVSWVEIDEIDRVEPAGAGAERIRLVLPPEPAGGGYLRAMVTIQP